MRHFTKPLTARLYEARARAYDRGVRVYEVEPRRCYWTRSQSGHGIYHVTRSAHGWECECDGYYFTGMCKHIAQVERRSEREGWRFGKVASILREEMLSAA